jgi:hypothetical protein
MISVHLLSREEVAEKLIALGCQKINQTVNAHSFWTTAWGDHFFLPEIPPDGMTAEWTLQECIAEIVRHTPVLN